MPDSIRQRMGDFDVGRALGDKTSSMLNSLRAGILIIDTETRKIAYANPAAVAMSGQGEGHLIGAVCHRLVCPEEIGNCPIIDRGQKLDNVECDLLRAGGPPLTVMKTVTPIMVDNRLHLLESFLDATDLKHLQKELQLLAVIDPDTGVFNRKLFFALAGREIARARRFLRPLCVAAIEVDDFEGIRASRGPAAGSALLQQLAALLRKRLRPYDLLGNGDTEQFAVTLIDCDLLLAREVMERIRDSVEAHAFVLAGGPRLSATISAGVAQVDAAGGNSLALDLLHADEALSWAQHEGGNRIGIFPGVGLH